MSGNKRMDELEAKVDVLAARLGIDFDAIAADEQASADRGAAQAADLEPVEA